MKDKTAELENANVELEQANRGLLEANKAKDEFLSVMSHELRTPLNVVMGYTGMIKEGILGTINPEQERALEKVITRSSDLLLMITQILQATSIEAGKIKIEKREVELSDLLDDLKSSYEVVTDKQILLNWDYPPRPLTIKTDSEKLKLILLNLINNALKFTDEGHVYISARVSPMPPRPSAPLPGSAGAGEQGRMVELRVADTGIGIPKEVLPSIFEMFRQVDSSETRSYGGVGMGLYIVKKYTELLGGRIEADSTPGKGSAFTVTLPC